MRHGLWGSLFALFILIGAPATARADFPNPDPEYMPTFGGDGPLYRVDVAVCPRGQFLRGIVARSGAWIDSLRIICAARSPGFVVGPVSNGELFGSSTGGAEQRVECNGRNGLIAALDFNTVREDEDRVVNKVRFTCRDFANYNFAGSFLIGGDDAGSGNLQSYCLPPKYAIGLHGKIHPWGYPGGIGLVCALRDF